jgi:hypothetical protein
MIRAFNVCTQPRAGFFPLTYFLSLRAAEFTLPDRFGTKCALKLRFNTQATSRGFYATRRIG